MVRPSYELGLIVVFIGLAVGVLLHGPFGIVIVIAGLLILFFAYNSKSRSRR